MKQYGVQTLLEKIESYISEMDYSHSPDGLYEPVRYAMAPNGKRIRPLFVLMAYNLYKESVEQALGTAAAMEMYHNSTLLHDDVMDNADIRRGKPTVHKKWNSNVAILSGDAMLILAYKYIATAPQGLLKPLLDLAGKTYMEIAEGQQYDMEFESRDSVSMEEYMEMIRLKTSVLLAACLKMGALLADAPQQDAEVLYDFGIKIGLAFQLQDDLLDVYGDPATFGKKTGGDILCNKKTYLCIKARQLAGPAEHKELDMWNAFQGNPQEKISGVTAVYDRLGVREICQAEIDRLFGQGIAMLDTLSADAWATELLRGFVSKMMKRNV